VYQYHTIENMYENIAYIDPTIAKILIAGKEDAFASKKLIQLAQVDISSVKLEHLEFKMDYEKYASVICDQHGFSSFRKLLNELQKEETMPKQVSLF
jgi:5'-3' exonuclease